MHLPGFRPGLNNRSDAVQQTSIQWPNGEEGGDEEVSTKCMSACWLTLKSILPLQGTGKILLGTIRYLAEPQSLQRSHRLRWLLGHAVVL